MPGVVELRIHGVGEATAESLLGEESPADVVRVGGSGISFFAARRRDLKVEGYLWGKLTSRALLQPVWLALLPFTLVNVAGWMHRPDEEARSTGGVARAVFRGLIVALALALTVDYAFWGADIALNRAYRWEGGLPFLQGKPHWFQGDPRGRILVGAFLLGLAVILLGVAAVWIQSKFEGFVGPSGPNGPGSGDDESGQSGASSWWRRAGRIERFTDRAFWDHASRARFLLAVHALVALAAIVIATLHARSNAVGDDANLHLGVYPAWSTFAALLVIVALALWHVLGWRTAGAFHGRGRFRWVGPASAAATGLGMATGVFYGLALAADRVNADRIRALGAAFGFSTMAWVLAIVIAIIWFRVRRHKEIVRSRTGPATDPWFLPASDAEEAHEPDGVGGDRRSDTSATSKRVRAPVARKAVASARTFALGTLHLDLVLTWTALVFVVSSLVMLARGAPGEGGALSMLAAIGNWTAVVAAGLVLGFLIRRSYKPGSRQLIGVLWEVLTFWPRRYHPFAVRPYAERSVPELEYRLRYHVEEGESVVFSAHSQGAILAYAALKHLESEITHRIALLTYGCPLRSLYGMAFPAYFKHDDFVALRGRLFNGKTSDGLYAGWRNLYHLTDYIGQWVFSPETDPNENAFEEVVPDPARHPTRAELAANARPAWPDPPRTVWVDLGRHSMYREEVRVKEWTSQVRDALETVTIPASRDVDSESAPAAPT